MYVYGARISRDECGMCGFISKLSRDVARMWWRLLRSAEPSYTGDAHFAEAWPSRSNQVLTEARLHLAGSIKFGFRFLSSPILPSRSRFSIQTPPCQALFLLLPFSLAVRHRPLFDLTSTRSLTQPNRFFRRCSPKSYRSQPSSWPPTQSTGSSVAAGPSSRRASTRS